jgi:hypothetical protein
MIMRLFKLHGIVSGAALVALAGSAGESAAQQGESRDDATINCISLNQVENTSVVDNDTILFYMRGDEVYRNDLPHDCPTLESEDTFMYRVTIGQLCSVDVITVLMDMGSRFMPGPSCGLGMFREISAAEAETLEADTPSRASAE